MFSDQQIAFFSDRHASNACSVCPHVFAGQDITHFGNVGFTYVAGCCADCLYERNDRTTVRCDHLFSRQPDVLSLLHLPIYGLAIRDNEAWKLGCLELAQEAELIAGQPYIKRSVAEFMKDTDELVVLKTGKFVHETSFATGVRILPSWSSLDDAKRYSKQKVRFPLSLFTRTKKMRTEELLSKSIEDGHNYLCIQEDDFQWECIIVDEVLDLQRNTLTLE